MKLKPITYPTAVKAAKWMNYVAGVQTLVWLAWFLGMAWLAPNGFKGIANTALSLGWLPFMLINQFVQIVMIRWSAVEDYKRILAWDAEMQALMAQAMARAEEKKPPLH